MTEKIQVKAVDLIRNIRDKQAQMLAGKSKAEVMDFFRKSGEAARKEAEQMRSAKLPHQPRHG
jgi:hypothetical protein